MSFIVQQADIDVINQGTRTINIRAELLNNNFQTVESLEGNVISDDYSIDADSDIRRSYKVSLVVSDSTFHIGRDTKIWFDKYIKLSVGIYHIREKEFRYYPVGIFIFDTADYSFDLTTKTLTLSCLDLTAKLTGVRGGQISGSGVSIHKVVVDNNNEPVLDDNGNEIPNMIRSSLLSTVTELGGINKFRIDDIGKPIPYDLHFNTGTYVYDIIKTLRDLYPGWETFFDEDRFICRQIPLYDNDPIIMDAQTFAPFVISEDSSIDFGKIYNVTEVWGKTLDSNYYTDNVTMIGKVYQLNYEKPLVSELTDGYTFGFKASHDNLANAQIKVNDFNSYEIIGEDNKPISPGEIKSGKSYVVKYKVSGNRSFFYYMGQYQIVGITKLVSKYPSSEKIAYDLENEPTTNISYRVDPDSPFCSDYEDMGEIRQVLSGNEYDNIDSEDLALQRAEYENWLTTDMMDSISLKMIDIPWIDVNQKIEYYSYNLNKTDTYLIKSKQGSTTKGTMTVNMVRFKPLYPWVREYIEGWWDI